MRKLVVLIVLAAAILVGVGLFVGGSQPAPGTTAGRQGSPIAGPREPAGPFAGDEATRVQRLRVRADEREAMRERIAAAMQAREVSAAAKGSRIAEAGTAEVRRGAAPEQAAEAAAPADAMIDRTGNHGYLTRVMSQELIPLADECYALARETQPDLAGMLVFELEIVGDEEIGGVIDAVEVGANNEIADPGLLECVRESLLATTLPPPEIGGTDAVALSMRFAPDEKQ